MKPHLRKTTARKLDWTREGCLVGKIVRAVHHARESGYPCLPQEPADAEIRVSGQAAPAAFSSLPLARGGAGVGFCPSAPSGARKSGGMTLLECVCALAVLTILFSVLSQTFISTTRLSAASNKALDRVRQAAEIRDAFSGAVREAGRVADGVLDYKTGGDCLVLELPPAPDTAARRYAVLRRLPSGKFARLDLEERDGECKATYPKTYALWTKALRFPQAGNGRLVTLEMDLPNAAQSPNRPGVIYRFSAAMRSMLVGEGRA